jgi:hypothetical protein
MSTEPLKEYFEVLRIFGAYDYKRGNDETSHINRSKVGSLIEQGSLSGIDVSSMSN